MQHKCLRVLKIACSQEKFMAEKAVRKNLLEED